MQDLCREYAKLKTWTELSAEREIVEEAIRHGK
jgi:hypothetical protein